MRVVLQRVASASVDIDRSPVAAIGPGLLVLAAVAHNDSDPDANYIVDKTVNLRIFPDNAGRFDRSVLDIGGSLLIVSQFTLYADTRKGRRPSFSAAAPPDAAAARFDDLVQRFRQTGAAVQTGRFQEMMRVSLVNDGPVTIAIDSADRLRPRG